jgi:hypothetical protein
MDDVDAWLAENGSENTDDMLEDDSEVLIFRNSLIRSLSDIAVASPEQARNTIESFLRDNGAHPSPMHRSATATTIFSTMEGIAHDVL